MVAIGWMLRTLLNAWRHHRPIKAQAELQYRLIDKLAGSEEMARYLEGGTGRHLLEAPTPRVRFAAARLANVPGAG